MKRLLLQPVLLAGLSIAFAATAAAFLGARWLAPPASKVSLDRLVQRCELEMLRGTCRVQTGTANVSPAERVVFVAGVGAIDGEAYRQLRESGQALCGTVRDACSRDWQGARCRAARALHGEP